jgi:hypothetical protein
MRIRVIVMLMAAAALTSPLAAQNPRCGSVYVFCSPVEYSHTFVNEDPDFEEFNGEGYHPLLCKVCIAGDDPVPAEQCHPECEISDPHLQVAYSILLEKAGSQNHMEVIRAAERIADFVLLNELRRSLQILSCDGRGIIANIPLGDFYADAAAVLRHRRTDAIPLGPGL